MLRHTSKCQTNQQLYAPQNQMNLMTTVSTFLASVLRAGFTSVKLQGYAVCRAERFFWPWAALSDLKAGWREGSWWLTLGQVLWQVSSAELRRCTFPPLKVCCSSMSESTIDSLLQRIGRLGRNLIICTLTSSQIRWLYFSYTQNPSSPLYSSNRLHFWP